MTELQDFVYDSLPQSSEATSHAIRLLKIHAGDTSTQLKYSLETYNYNTCPEYWALSYPWGPETPSHIIVINDRRYRVRQNLFNFIQAFRSPHNVDFYLWIDQLCINQEDITFPNVTARSAVRASTTVAQNVYSPGLECAQSSNVVNVPPAKRKEPMSLELLRGYRSIIANSHFNRLRIVQEMARAKSILVMIGAEDYGAKTTSWRHFNMAFIQLMLELTIILTTAIAAQQEIMLRQEIRDHKILLQLLEVKKHLKAIDIFDLIEAFSDFGCADPRDKLYALQDIGHLPQQLFTIDYGRDKHQLAKSGNAPSNRQFDILSMLAQAMRLQVGIQVVTPEDDSESVSHGTQENSDKDAATSLQARAEDIKKFKESIDHVANEEVRMFGPRYDEETGHGVSPFSKQYSRGHVPYIFKVPASVDLEGITKMAKQDLSKRLDRDEEVVQEVDKGEGVDTVAEGSAPDGYQTITMLSGDIRHWGLPPLDSDE